jgi:hypothetical protein
MIHYVPLPRLPENFRVPDKLQQRFWYDRDKQALAYEGPMFKLTFDRLREISHDYDYQRALEALFQLAAPAAEDVPRRGTKTLLIVAGCLLGLAAVAGVLWLRG